MRQAWVAVVATVLVLSACQERQPQPTLILEIIGTRAAFDRFQVSVSPLIGNDPMRFAGRFFVKTFSLVAPLDIAVHTPLDLMSMTAGLEVDRKMWMPFVCINYPSYEQKTAAGWFGRETLQASLRDDGTLSLDAEFERPLNRSCEWTSPGGGSGEGAGTQNPTATFCTEPERLNTSVQITDVSDPEHPVPLTATLCQAIHYKPTAPDPVFSGSIVNQLVARRMDGALVTMSLSHCWKSSDTFPVEVSPSSPAEVPCDSFSISPGLESPSIEASAGAWTLHNGPELPGGGHQISDIDLIFGLPEQGGPIFTAKGHIDLPILKTLAARLR
jgi:hypothetical protein